MNKNVATAIVSILLGFTVGIVIAMIMGIEITPNGISTYNPIKILTIMLQSFTGFDIREGSFNSRHIGQFIVSSIPLILTGLSVSFAFKTGLFNIGAEGQLMMGALFATLTGLFIDLPMGIHAIVAVLAAGLAGFLFGMIPGILKAYFNVHEVVSCIMLNYVALSTANLVYRMTPGFSGANTVRLPDSALLTSDFLRRITNNSQLNWSILIVIIAVIFYHVVITKTTFGYRLRAIGNSKDAAEYSGMKVKQGVVLSMGISGMFAGLAGASLVLGVFGFGRVLTGFESFGYNGIAVALVGATSSIGIVFAGALFGMLSVVQASLQAAGIPRDIAVMISSLIIFFCAIPLAYENIVNKISKKEIKSNVNDQSGGEV